MHRMNGVGPMQLRHKLMDMVCHKAYAMPRKKQSYRAHSAEQFLPQILCSHFNG
jgi:hypothetical protein